MRSDGQVKKLFSDTEERSAVTTVLAASLLIADVINHGMPPEGNAEEARVNRELRIGRAFNLARQFVAFAEKAGERS